MTTPTPRPWRRQPGMTHLIGPETEGDAFGLAEFGGRAAMARLHEVQLANAAHALLCVNAHEALVAALVRLLEQHPECACPPHTDEWPSLACGACQARAALALAKE